MSANVPQIINDAAVRVNTFTEAFKSLASQAITATQSASAFTPFTASPVSLHGERPQYQGNLDFSKEFLSTYNNALRDIKPEFGKATSEFIAQWLPSCVTAATNDWICNTILTGGTGLPPGIENAIWQRARKRELVEARRLENEALDQGASRGFPIPPGAITARMLMVQQEAADRSSTIVRDEAIKHIDIIITNVRLAVTQGVAIRGQVIGALGDFIRAHFLPEQLAIQKAEAILHSKGMLLTSAAEYYRAVVAEAELDVQVAQINATSYNASQGNAAQSGISGTSLRAKVAEGLSVAYGSAAASAASAILGVASDSTITVA